MQWCTRTRLPQGQLHVWKVPLRSKRLLLVLYALGTDVGIKPVADGGGHGENEAALRATATTCATP